MIRSHLLLNQYLKVVYGIRDKDLNSVAFKLFQQPVSTVCGVIFRPDVPASF